MPQVQKEGANQAAEEVKTPPLPEYGFGGDQAGARRNRRSFRFIVAVCVFFAVVLWISDRYLRYDLTEAQYRMALTLETDSARAVLRNVVKRDKEAHDVSNPKYLEALAAIEEDDVILPAYAEVYRLDPGNAAMLINFGCRLFMYGQLKDARERFRESSVLPPKNALPRYLEAAALAVGATTTEDFIEAIALVARTNNSGDPVIFPQPLWHASLPPRGAWHAKMRREIVDRCCAPLYRFHSKVIANAKTDIDAAQIRDWVSWLTALQVMGERLLGNSTSEGINLGAPQAMAGIQIQLDALRMLERIYQTRQAKEDGALATKIEKVEMALEKVKDFEAQRDTLIAAHREILKMPLRFAGQALLLFTALFLAALVTYRVFYHGRQCWTLPHPTTARILMTSGVLTLFAILTFFIIIHDRPQISAPVRALEPLWMLTLAAMALYGLVYPAVTLPTLNALLRSRSDLADLPPDDLNRLKKLRRMAYCSLTRRYYGVLIGSFCLVLSAWFIVYRIAEGLYPVQLPLLMTGLEDQELALIRHLQHFLKL